MDFDLAVIIPNWNGAEVLRTCLDTCVEHVGSAPAEVIVFDNGSDDGSAELAETYQDRLALRVVRSPVNVGYAAACNRAAEVSNAPFLFLLNNDAKLTGSIDRGLRYLRSHPTVGVCQGPLLTSDGKYIDSVGSLMTRWGFAYHIQIGAGSDRLPPSRRVFSTKGAAMFVRREALGELGLFDEEAVAFFEESDLCWRVQVMGWTVEYVRELPVVLHESGVTTSRVSYSVWEFHSFKNRLRSVLKNAELRTIWTMLPLHLVVLCGASVDGLRCGSARPLVSVGRAVLWNVRHIRGTLRLRQAVQRRRRQEDGELLAAVFTRMSLQDFYRQRAGYNRAHGR